MSFTARGARADIASINQEIRKRETGKMIEPPLFYDFYG